MVLETITDGIRIFQIIRQESRRRRRQQKVRRSIQRRLQRQEILSPQQQQQQLEEHQQRPSTEDLISSALALSRQHFDTISDDDDDEDDEQHDATRRPSVESSESSDSSYYCGAIPPASTSAIINLLHLRLRSIPKREDDTSEEQLTCVICSEDLEDGCVVTRLQCGHLYHAECVVPWLARTCTCPTCRYELPTDCSGYEVSRRRRMKGREIQDEDEIDEENVQPVDKEPIGEEHIGEEPVDEEPTKDGDTISVYSASSSGAVGGEKRHIATPKKRTRTVRAWCGSVVVKLTMQE